MKRHGYQTLNNTNISQRGLYIYIIYSVCVCVHNHHYHHHHHKPDVLHLLIYMADPIVFIHLLMFTNTIIMYISIIMGINCLEIETIIA